jgi:hypothetical protein
VNLIIIHMQQIILNGVELNELLNSFREIVRDELATQTPATPSQPSEPEPIKIEEVCRLLRISKVTAHDWANKGILTRHRISNKVYFYKHEVLTALKKAERRRV